MLEGRLQQPGDGRAGRRRLIVDDHIVAGLEQAEHGVGTDISGPAGNQNFWHFPSIGDRCYRKQNRIVQNQLLGSWEGKDFSGCLAFETQLFYLEIMKVHSEMDSVFYVVQRQSKPVNV